MADNTPYYNLKKPAADDFYNVVDQNVNMDIIDDALKTLNDKTENIDFSELATKDELGTVQNEVTTHKADKVAHITAAERTTWNSKETTIGAQDKANGAYIDAVKWARSFGLGDNSNGDLGTSADLNTVVNSGFFRLGNTPVNAPEGTAYGQMIVVHGKADTIAQILIPYNQYKLYVRSGNPVEVGGKGTWNRWFELETTDGSQAKATKAKDDAIGWAKNFGLGDDAPDITDCNLTGNVTGFYQTNIDTLNRPDSDQGTLIHIARAGRPTQLHIGYANGKTHTRTLMANGWGEWKESETTDGSQAKVNVVSQALTTHDSKNASLTTKGHVQLSSSVTSTSTSLAATPSAVKAAMDRANEAFQSASNGKTLVGNAITGFDSKITLPANPSFQDLADAIDRIRLVILEPGANLFASSDREIGFYNSSYQVQKEIIVPYGGTIRVSFQAASYFNGSAYYRIYVNGSPIGIQRVLTNSGQFTTFTQDIAIKAGDRVQLFAYSTNGTAYARNFNISTNLLSATVVL